MEPDPQHVLDVGHAAHQFCNARLAIEVGTIVGQFLLYDLKLLHAGLGQLLHLFQYLLYRARHMATGDQGYGAVGTVAVAAFGYLDEGIMLRRGELALEVRAAGREGLLPLLSTGRGRRPQVLQQLAIIELAVKLVHLGYRLLQLLLVALRQAAHDIQAAQPPLVLGLHKLQDGVDALLLGRLDESTGVDDRNLSLRTLRVVYAVVAQLLKLTHELLRIDKILRAAHGYDIYLILFHTTEIGEKRSQDLSLNIFRHHPWGHTIPFMAASPAASILLGACEVPFRTGSRQTLFC